MAAAESEIVVRRRSELRTMQIVLAWADTFSGNPQDDPRFRRKASKGGPRLVRLGGDGTPKVQDLALLELAVARCESLFSTRRAIADGLDLRHRLPELWQAVSDLRVEMWVARKIAMMCRKLDADQVKLVDAALAEAADEPPTVLLQIAEAKIIEADLEAHEERVRKAKQHKGVWIRHTEPGDAVDDEAGEPGTGMIFARLDEGDLSALDAVVEELANKLAENAETTTDAGGCALGIDHFRAEALAMLADPKAVLDFFAATDPQPEDEPPAPTAERPMPDKARIYAHIDAEVLLGMVNGVARVEGLGPRLLSQLRDLLSHHQVFLTPVVDLNAGRSTKAYEHPTKVKLRSELRTGGEVFPHSSTRINHAGRSPDHDHPTPFDVHGPPGQTGDHNDAPLTRQAHRAKTHLGYSVLQLGPDKWLWGTPHGLYRLVTTKGTTMLGSLEAQFIRGTAIDVTGFNAA
ncbi:hypothetical protein GCM10022242_34880 [Nocardioides panacisoli]|uniref:DUF222 domain-containing protein n=1 Tax=Nocardioides panacisoli TaxID=627624 RepID=A0ABP7IYX7_9ACTN